MITTNYFFRIAAVLIAFPMEAHAERLMILDCLPINASPAPIGDDPIVRTSIEIHGTDWSIAHTTASGSRYERERQYALHDDSTPASSAWTGILIGQPHLSMTGRILSAGNAFSYTEYLYDDRRAGTPVLTTRSTCFSQTIEARPQQAVATPSIPGPAPSTPAAVRCIAVADPTDRLACYDRAADYRAPSTASSASPAGASAPETTVSPEVAKSGSGNNLVVLTDDEISITKNYMTYYTGGGWRLTIQSKSDLITITEIAVNRGNCVPDGDSRSLPVALKFGQSWHGQMPCNPIEATIKTNLGTGTFTWSR